MNKNLFLKYYNIAVAKAALAYINNQVSDTCSVEWVSDCSLAPNKQFSSISWWEQVHWWDDDDDIDLRAQQDFYSASSKIQQIPTSYSMIKPRPVENYIYIY